MERTGIMIDLKRFETCVCQERSVPDSLCDGDLSFEEKGKKVKLSLRENEEAKAVAIDQCVCIDNELKCDGLFLYRRRNKHWIIMVELKGSDIEHAFEQLAYMRNKRPEYKEIEKLFMNNENGEAQQEAFIVSNVMVSPVDKQKLEKSNGIRVKAILHSVATKPVPDIRQFL